MDKSNYDLIIIQKYIDCLEKQFPIEKVILFGSYAHETATEHSDIDLAIISPEFGKKPLLERMKLYELRYDAGIDSLIDPHPFGSDEFAQEENFFVAEIKKTGIDISRQVLT